MKKLLVIILVFLSAIRFLNAQTEFQTICNPLNLSYMFSSGKPSYREAADPSMVVYQDEYYLFLSHSGGYYHSADLIHWDLIETSDLPVDFYAPTAVVMNDEIYFLTSIHDKLYKTADPKSGKWEVVKEHFPYTYTDPMLFLDDDGRLYYYGGCSNEEPIRGAEIDPQTFDSKGSLKSLIYGHPEQNGWEVPGDYNTLIGHKPWIEGAWMNKFNGKYYLQYANPGTEFKSYNDGVYVSDAPLGPFTLSKQNPFAYKPEGFVNGAGHGSTFRDKYGNYWHIGTSTISQRHLFERRIGLFPVFLDEDGLLYACTGFGDYPMIIPDRKISSPEELFPGWMLLSYNKEVSASSVSGLNTAQKAVDEDIRTWWSAETGNANEYFTLNLQQECEVYALQINFADEGADISGRKPDIYYQYLIQCSSDGTQWETLVDRLTNTLDAPHDYIQLKQPVRTQYLRLSQVRTPSCKISLSDFRVFGLGLGEKPEETAFTLQKDKENPRALRLSWEQKPGVTGYNIRYGVEKDKLYLNYSVYDANSVVLHSLNAAENYFFTVDAFNEAGITRGTEIKSLR